MKILQIHNQYTHLGGEEVVVAAEQAMLEKYGNEVQQWVVSSELVHQSGTIDRAKIALSSIWSLSSYQAISRRLKEFNPNIVHVHNTVPLVSPAVYTACQDAGIPVVQTLHNFRLICPGHYLYRNGKICEDCIGKTIPISSIVHGCYRNSRTQTAVVAAGLVSNGFRGVFRNEVDIYIALTRLARQKFIAGGLPAEKIVIKPNFVTADVQPGSHAGGYALFVGKIIDYKGIETLLNAWHLLNEPIPLKIVGQGPLEALLKSNLPSEVEYLGRQPREHVIELIRNASFVVFPSEWYEGFPMTITEAFAAGTPVIASNLGAAAEIVRDEFSGWKFIPGDAEDLAAVVQKAWADPEELRRRGALARKQYDEQYSLKMNFPMLMSIYNTAIAWRQGRASATVF
jgi:glycosyltransferase involved in cell wall biosynthesis